jgi:hypothetical protein
MHVSMAGVVDNGDCEECPNLNSLHVLGTNPSMPCDWYLFGARGCGNDDSYTCAVIDLLEVIVGERESVGYIRVYVDTRYGDPYGTYIWEKAVPRVRNCYEGVSFGPGDLIYTGGVPNCSFAAATIMVVGSNSPNCP